MLRVPTSSNGRPSTIRRPGAGRAWYRDGMSPPLPRIAVCGHGHSGKVTAARHLAGITPLPLEKTTSEVIAPYAAARLGQPVVAAFAERHQKRAFWFEVGNELRAGGPRLPGAGVLGVREGRGRDAHMPTPPVGGA